MGVLEMQWGKNLKRIGEEMGREEIAKRALAIAEQIVKTGSYKNAIAGIGRMTVLASCCRYDYYWSEKLLKGKLLEIENLEYWDKNKKHYPTMFVV